MAISGHRTIYLSTELIFPPVPELKIGKDKIRAMYNKLHEPGGYPYENLELQAEPPTLSTRRGDGQSKCQIGSDRIRIDEEKPSMPLDDFIDAAKTVLKSLGSDVHVFIMQRVLIRCIAQPNNVTDSLDLLAGRLADAYDTIGPFERPPSYFGVRFRFGPAIEGEDDPPEDEKAKSPGAPEATGTADGIHPVKAAEPSTPAVKTDGGNDRREHRGFLTLRFETYSEDIRQVWMELAATYFFSEKVAAAADLTEVEQNIREAYQFVSEKAIRFLDQFDKKDDTEEESGS
jgi:hypothetical protein